MLDTPEYPQGIVWELCELEKPCLNLRNAKQLALYLSAVDRYHRSIKETCNKL